MITLIQTFGGLYPRNLRGPKSRKFSPISDNFRLWLRISSESIDISKIGNKPDRHLSLLGSTKKFGELWSNRT